MKKTNAIRLLDKLNANYDLIPYEYDSNNLDVKKIATDNKLKIEFIYKTLIIKGDKSGIIVVIIPGNHTLNFKKTAKVSGNKKIMMLPISELQKNTGYVRGGCSPLGMKKKFQTYISAEAIEQTEILINAGTKGLLISVAPRIIYEICDAEYAEISDLFI